MIELKVTGLNKLKKIIEQYPAISEKHVNLSINRALLRVLAEEKQEAPFGVSGQLRDNWKVDMGRFEGRLYSLQGYAKTVNEGGVPNPFPTAEDLEPWAKKKGLNPWVIARAIKKRGHLKANPFFDRALTKAEQGVQQELNQCIKNIALELSAINDSL